MSSSLDNHLDISALVEMGFTKERVEQALAATNHKGIQPAIEWLFSHPVADIDSGQKLGGPVGENETDANNSSENPIESEGAAATSDGGEAKEADGGVALSLVCEDCGKQLRSEMEAQQHAARSGHQNFAESSDAVKPLTAEEKEEQKKRLQQKLEERRQQRLIEEKNQEKLREKTRRKTGKDVSQAKEEFARQELRKIAEERRKEKLEEKRLRQKLKDQIAKDRADFKAKTQPTKVEAKAPTQTLETAVPVKKDYDTCRIQFRLPDSSTLNSTFKASDTLEALHTHISEHRKDFSSLPYTLSTTFPRRVFQDSDRTKTLKELGLVPSSVLVLGK